MSTENTTTGTAQHELAVMDRTGDTKTIWDPENETEVQIARETFEKFKKKGYIAFSVRGKDGEKGEQIREFDPKAGRIIMSPPLGGG